MRKTIGRRGKGGRGESNIKERKKKKKGEEEEEEKKEMEGEQQ